MSRTEQPTARSSKERSLELYRLMFQARCIDEIQAKLVKRGEAFFHLSGAGHETSAVLSRFLTPEDYLHLHYRDKALMLARGVPPQQFFHSLLCNAESYSLGRQMSAFFAEPQLRILPMITLVGNNALQAAGVAAALKRKGPDAAGQMPIVVCSMGDGTTQQGEVLEAVAEAVRSKLPVLFLIQDNHYAISTQTKGRTFYSLPGGEAAQFLALPIHRIDGRDAIQTEQALGPIVTGIRETCQPAIVVLQVERLCNHTSSDDERRYRSETEIGAAAESGDPIKNLRRQLSAEGANLDELEKQWRLELERMAEAALDVWTAPPALDAKRPLVSSCRSRGNEAQIPHSNNDPQNDQSLVTSAPTGLTMLEAVREVLRQRLTNDERVTLFGEDIEDPKGDVFGLTRGLSTAFSGRVMNSPLSESTIIGMSIGRALAGERPVAMIQFADFLPLALNQIMCELSTIYWRTAGAWECPVIIMAPCGGFRPGLGPFHGQTMEAVLAHCPGLDVVMPANAEDAAQMLNAAFESGRPTVFLYPKVCLNERDDLVPADIANRVGALGKARMVQKGDALTLVSWGAAVPICKKVAQALGAEKIGVDLIDLCWISPWDREAVIRSAEKTGALAVVHEDSLTAGFGAEVIAAVSEALPDKIKCARITRSDTYIPCRYANQLEVLPSFKRIMAEVTRLLGLDLGWNIGESEKGPVELVKLLGSSPADRMVTVVDWKVKPGDSVNAGDLIADLESDKAVSELACPSTGTIERILVPRGESVAVGTPALELRPLVQSDRESHTMILQKATPVLKRGTFGNAPSPVRTGYLRPDTRHFSLVGMSSVCAAEGSVVVTNEDLAGRFPNRTAQEIFRLTGIKKRRHIAPGETIVNLATTAARQVLTKENLTIADIHAIICSTTTPVEITPSLACTIQAGLCENGQTSRAKAYDILAACSGFIYALSAAFDFLATRPTGKVLVVTAEALSRAVNPSDFDTAVLFGDAATATVVYGTETRSRGAVLLHRPLVAAKPDPGKILRVPTPGGGFIEMQGKKVFGEAVRTMLTTLEEACAANGVNVDELDMIIPHQANGRIIEAVQSRLGQAGSRVINLVADTGNTSSSTIPLCLSRLNGNLKAGAKVGLCAFGGGFTFGAAVLENLVGVGK